MSHVTRRAEAERNYSLEKKVLRLDEGSTAMAAGVFAELARDASLGRGYRIYLKLLSDAGAREKFLNLLCEDKGRLGERFEKVNAEVGKDLGALQLEYLNGIRLSDKEMELLLASTAMTGKGALLGKVLPKLMPAFDARHATYEERLLCLSLLMGRKEITAYRFAFLGELARYAQFGTREFMPFKLTSSLGISYSGGVVSLQKLLKAERWLAGEQADFEVLNRVEQRVLAQFALNFDIEAGGKARDAPKSLADAVKRITVFVNSLMPKNDENYPLGPDAGAFFKGGDCLEHSYVLMDLLAQVGIPSRLVEYAGKSGPGHVVVQAVDERMRDDSRWMGRGIVADAQSNIVAENSRDRIAFDNFNEQFGSLLLKEGLKLKIADKNSYDWPDRYSNLGALLITGEPR